MIPSLNDIVFNPGLVEDFLIENKRNKSSVLQFLQSLNHDLFSARTPQSKVYQTAVNLAISLITYFRLSLEEVESLLDFTLCAEIYRNLKEKNTSFLHQIDFFRLYLHEVTKYYQLQAGEKRTFVRDENAYIEKMEILNELMEMFWNDPAPYLESKAFDDLQSYFIDGVKDRSEVYRLFRLKKSQRLLDALQDDSFGVDWLFNKNISIDKLSASERDFFNHAIRNWKVRSYLDESLLLIVSKPVDFFNTKCFLDLFFIKLLIADYAVIGEEEERFVRSNENLAKEYFTFYLNMSEKTLESVDIMPHYPAFSPKNHPFLFFLVSYRFGMEKSFATLDDIMPKILKRLPIQVTADSKQQSQNAILSGLEYEIFNFTAFSHIHANCLNDKYWNLLCDLEDSIGSVKSPEDLVNRLNFEDKCHTSSILLRYGITFMQQKHFIRAFHFVSTALKLSLKQYPFPQLKFASFCKNSLFELCFILVNEMQSRDHLELVCNVLRMLTDQIPVNCYRIVFFCANLINSGMINVAIESAKNFLQVAGKKTEIQKQTISLLKVLYNSSICISLFLEKSNKTDFTQWSPKHISLLVNASDSLFRNISSDSDMVNLFICFVSLLDNGEMYLNDFIGLFLGSLNVTIQSEDVICLKYFSKYSLFYANPNSLGDLSFEKSTGYASISDCNESLNDLYRPFLHRKEGSVFSENSLKSIIISLYEKPLSSGYFFSKSSLAFAEIIYLQCKYPETLTILLFYLMNSSQFFSIRLEQIEELNLICERLASCLWKMGRFNDLLLILQLLDKRTKFWFAYKLYRLDMIADECFSLLFDIDLIEYIAAITKNDFYCKHLVSVEKVDENQVKNRILKFLASKYLY